MAKAKTVSKKVSVKKAPADYSLEVRVNDLVLKATAKTMGEALSKIAPEFPFGAKTKVVVNYSKGKAKRLRILFPRQGGMLLRKLTRLDDVRAFWGLKLEEDLKNV